MSATVIVTVFFLGFVSGREVLPICGHNEEFLRCGTECEATCINLFEPKICSDVCVQGCFCQEGFVRSSENGDCVPIISCGNVPQCAPNEVYSSCASSCPLTCENKEPQTCPEVCVEGCICKVGTIRSTIGGPCVPIDSCNLEICGTNQEYKKCGSACPATCAHPFRVCGGKCVEGCFCRDGYILDERTQECVRIEHCPKLTI